MTELHSSSTCQVTPRIIQTHIPYRPALPIFRIVRQVFRAAFVQPSVVNGIVWVAVFAGEEDNVLRLTIQVDIRICGDGLLLYATFTVRGGQVERCLEFATLVTFDYRYNVACRYDCN
jgi:hypothetical protein